MEAFSICQRLPCPERLPRLGEVARKCRKGSGCERSSTERLNLNYGVEIMKAFITVMGHDTVGVVAKVSTLCSELDINIEDVTQSILQGMFAMIMLVDISKCSVSHEELHQRMDALAKEMGMQINLTRQEVFDAMHTI